MVEAKPLKEILVRYRDENDIANDIRILGITTLGLLAVGIFWSIVWGNSVGIIASAVFFLFILLIWLGGQTYKWWKGNFSKWHGFRVHRNELGKVINDVVEVAYTKEYTNFWGLASAERPYRLQIVEDDVRFREAPKDEFRTVFLTEEELEVLKERWGKR